MSAANVSRLLDDHLAARGEATALVFGGRRHRYADLERATARTARALLDLGVSPGERIAVVAGNSDHYAIAFLAASRIGAVSVPMNIRWAPAEIAYALDDCGARLLLVDERFEGAGREALTEAAGDVALLPLAHGDDSLAVRAARVPEDVDVPRAEVDFDDPHRILYTSGTTSRPKGVVHSHGNCAWNHLAMAGTDLVRQEDRILVAYPMFHVSGLECPGIFSTLAAGATVVLRDGADAASLLDELREERITGVVVLQPLLDELLAALEDADPLEHLRWLITGGSTPALVERFVRVLPGVRLTEVYAMTEATGAITVLDAPHMRSKVGRTGRPVRYLDLRIVDDAGTEAPANTTGHIEVRGPKIARKYWSPEPSRSRTPAPDRTPTEQDGWRDGWFRTGDLGELDDDGYLAFRNRAKEMLKTGGENVAMAEIERVVVDHPSVRAVCVVTIPHPRWEEAPKAYVLPERGATVDGDELEAYCRTHLAGYKVPREWAFVDELPFNHSGKVVRRIVQQREDAERLAATKEGFLT
ncbi:MAG: AMP-binding protein [Patulibacter sp.]|nr:AMP-binding protein [Patulibacter sp.]